MGRRAKSPKGKAKAKRAPARKSPQTDDARVRDLEKRLAEALRLKVEAQDQQAATAEILRVISSSPTDLQPVFDAIAENAQRLLRGWGALVVRFDGELLHVAGLRAGPGASEEPIRERFPQPASQDTLNGVVIRDRAVKQIANVETDDDWISLREHARRQGWRANLGVPMLHDGQPIGAITVTRREPGAFSAQEVDLLKTFADQAVIAIENVRLFNETKESLDRQTATSEILNVIASSPTDTQPVFDAIVERALRLSEATVGAVTSFDGELIHVVASNLRPDSPILRVFPMRPSRTGSLAARTVFERQIIHVPDALAEPEYNVSQQAAESGYRSVLSVPMLRDGTIVGTITVGRSQAGRYLDRQIALLQTFADQAVIAIENVRLFTELQTSNRELTTALDTQTATSDILRVISQSQTDVQPVFDAILGSAVRLLGAYTGGLTRIAGDQIELVAFTSIDNARDAAVRATYPQSLQSGDLHAQAIRGRVPLNFADAHTDPRLHEATHAYARARGWRSAVLVPMLRHDEAVGAIGVTRCEAGGFTDDEIALLQTFADQAVIAIENARLLTELQQRNEALTQAHAQVTEALEQQTATSEILRVISSSPTDMQPVFDAIARNARGLLAGHSVSVTRLIGDEVHLMAFNTVTPEGDALLSAGYPVRLDQWPLAQRTVREGTATFVEDVETHPDTTERTRRVARARGFRSFVWMPMVHGGATTGWISVTWAEPGPFSESHIALLQTFADQAVIAIENVRLFKELDARTQDLTRSVGELRALGEVGQAISSTLDLQTVLSTIVARATQLSGTDAGVIYEYDAQREVFVPRATEHLEAEIVETMLATPVRKGEGATGRLAEVQAPIQLPDILEAPTESRVRDVLVRAGYRALLAVPLVREDHLIGGLTVIRKTEGTFAPEVVELLRTFATQSALAIQNARLFLEIEDKSRQLEAASRHKSEFLANMSHELRTPMNAILGFSEVLAEGMFGEINDKQAEYLRDILESGRHLLSLINDILDLSKIEAGRMELEPSDFDLPAAIDNALTLVRERAGRRGITLVREIDQRVGTIGGDERKVKQVVLNLLSNAIKFTAEGGRIDVRATMRDGLVEVSVADTGVGIAPEDQEKVFEEFRQVGTADKKVEGTGLGLALSRKFIELHGGRIWVKSQVGHGSTFTFTLPVRRGQ